VSSAQKKDLPFVNTKVNLFKVARAGDRRAHWDTLCERWAHTVHRPPRACLLVGTQDMPEVQKPVLEHAPTETREEEITRESDVIKLVTNVTNAQKTDVVRERFIYEIKRDQWESPEKIHNLRVNLPNGLSARFMRMGAWESRPYTPIT
jgi:hypothetical protein